MAKNHVIHRCSNGTNVIYYLPVKMFIEFVPVLLRISLADTEEFEQSGRYWRFDDFC